MTTLYSDRLIEITDEEIVFRGYYLPVAGSRFVPLDRIGSVRVLRPSLFRGSWRIWGSGDFRTWFTWDPGRPGRERIFVASVRGGYWKIGFTVEDSARATEVLLELGVLIEDRS
ncbi:MAG TPA: hypothetical protein VFA86_10740 [Gammaproteobacteria bacterium]|nr:hypothetical protein [Gammaproteobacteria bacterium]